MANLSNKDFCVYALSDMHTDYKQNMDWVRNDLQSHPQDALIVAGDISDSLGVLRETLSILKKKFKYVFYVIGNHDVWIRNSSSRLQSIESKPSPLDSWEKYLEIRRICSEVGVFITPQLLENHIWIVPLLSWHHASFDTEPDIRGFDIPDVSSVMLDFALCKWPKKLGNVHEAFDRENDIHSLRGARLSEIRESNIPVISFSHFLPRIELCPEKRFLSYPNLPKAIGSQLLQQRLAILSPDIHVFGHTHFGWDMTIEGTRFVQCPVAYPRERLNRLSSLFLFDINTKLTNTMHSIPQLIKLFDTSNINDDNSSECNEAGSNNGLCPPYSAYWSEHYRSHQREPENIQLAPWVIDRYTRIK